MIAQTASSIRANNDNGPLLDADLDNIISKRNTGSITEEPCIFTRGNFGVVDFLLKLDPPEPVNFEGSKSQFLERTLPIDRHKFKKTPSCIGYDGTNTICYLATIQIGKQCSPRRFDCTDCGQIVIMNRSYRQFRRKFFAACAEYGIDYELPEPPPRFSWKIEETFTEEEGWRYVAHFRLFDWTWAISWESLGQKG